MRRMCAACQIAKLKAKNAELRKALEEIYDPELDITVEAFHERFKDCDGDWYHIQKVLFTYTFIARQALRKEPRK